MTNDRKPGSKRARNREGSARLGRRLSKASASRDSQARKADLQRLSHGLARPTEIPPYGKMPLAHALLLHEIHEGVYLPLATFAGSLHPRSQYSGETAWVAAVHERVFLPFLKNLPKNTLDADKRDRVKTFYEAVRPGTRKSIDRERLKAEFRNLQRQVVRHKPFLPAPEEMPLYGSIGERETALRAAEEQILAAEFAPAYSHFFRTGARFDELDSSLQRLSRFAKDYAELHDLATAFQREALTLRINRQRRVYHALVGSSPAAGRGKTEWIRLAMDVFQGPDGRGRKAVTRREAATLAALTLRPELADDSSYEATMELGKLTEAARDLDYAAHRRKRRRPPPR